MFEEILVSMKKEHKDLLNKFIYLYVKKKQFTNNETTEVIFNKDELGCQKDVDILIDYLQFSRTKWSLETKKEGYDNYTTMVISIDATNIKISNTKYKGSVFLNTIDYLLGKRIVAQIERSAAKSVTTAKTSTTQVQTTTSAHAASTTMQLFQQTSLPPRSASLDAVDHSNTVHTALKRFSTDNDSSQPLKRHHVDEGTNTDDEQFISFGYRQI